jgi:nitrite reductase/ring-hydroxylating ferredoxin subunit
MVRLFYMAFVKAASLAKLTSGTMLEFRKGEQQLALCNVEGQIHVLENHCPHRGGPLAQGALHGTTVVCPWHAWEFDCITGACDFNPEIVVKRYPVRLEGDDILVDI